jgi:hypothetical protein
MTVLNPLVIQYDEPWLRSLYIDWATAWMVRGSKIQTGCRAYLASYSVGTRGFLPGDKQTGRRREFDHSPPPSARG